MYEPYAFRNSVNRWEIHKIKDCFFINMKIHGVRLVDTYTAKFPRISKLAQANNYRAS